ncbi:hypothetical protein SADUNF_Sadunf19G0089900 [Salix dunnii]|uniref:Uncharacterized protein n=1 Tax=Salix dunnii TaxID=1413687 RepID=A0A835MI07_9ROSI|nr:hypothetical protein SADUNF_Sadunf19G0089900 [Salix dunnii]
MVEISEGQKRVRQGQMEVREKFEEISVEAAKGRSAANQLRLDLMFEIVKARAEKDSAKDAFLTQKLRSVILANVSL